MSCLPEARVDHHILGASFIMEIERILSELSENRGYFPREAVEEAIARRSEITPYLMRCLQAAGEGPAGAEDEEPSLLPVYALYLLAQFRERSAYPLVLALCGLPQGGLDALIGDTITEGLPRIIASVFDGDIAPIKSVIEDASIDEYVRASAIRSLSILALEGVLARKNVIAYFTKLFRKKLDKVYSHVWDALACEAVDLYAMDLAGDIRGAYRKGLLSPEHMGPEEVDQIFAMQEEDVLAQAREKCGGLIDDVVEEMDWWACFEQEDDFDF